MLGAFLTVSAAALSLQRPLPDAYRVRRPAVHYIKKTPADHASTHPARVFPSDHDQRSKPLDTAMDPHRSGVQRHAMRAATKGAVEPAEHTRPAEKRPVKIFKHLSPAHRAPKHHTHPVKCTLFLEERKASTAKGDPFCKAGLADTSLTACCQSDCSECSDVSDLCKAKDESGRGSTCCPEEILKADVSCDKSQAPCAMPPAKTTGLTSEDGVRNAAFDCKNAVKGEMDRQRVSTDYLKHEGSELAVAPKTMDCNEEQLGTDKEWTSIEAIAYACEQRDGCGGFTTEEGKPGCLLAEPEDLSEMSPSPGVDTYIRVVNKKGLSFHITAGPWSECSVSCGTGTQTRELHCNSEMGKDDSLERCQGIFSLSGLPPTEQTCNDFGCPCEKEQTIEDNKVAMSNSVTFAYDSTGEFACSTFNAHTTGSVGYHCTDWEGGKLEGPVHGECKYMCYGEFSYKDTELMIPGSIEHSKHLSMTCPMDFTGHGLTLQCDDGTTSVIGGECFHDCTVQMIVDAMKEATPNSFFPAVTSKLTHGQSTGLSCPTQGYRGSWTISCDDGKTTASGECVNEWDSLK
jgi:hypothetical protein